MPGFRSPRHPRGERPPASAVRTAVLLVLAVLLTHAVVPGAASAHLSSAAAATVAEAVTGLPCPGAPTVPSGPVARPPAGPAPGTAARSDAVPSAASGPVGEGHRDHRGGHGTVHAQESCALGQPQPGPGLDRPERPALPPAARPGPAGPPTGPRAAVETGGLGAPADHAARSAVLRQ
ncbi:hypothetical protein [Streptomyces sp. NPDC097619]|uniref:hypothetical protein n=1 Tax=Streptomyces sp. NPDC097619 TaxID=3157228 RepID=UPI003325EAA8